MVISYICETCGKKGRRSYAKDKIPQHFFCSVPCQNEWQKTREDIVLKNKSPEFRKKVSEGLKKRKIKLGNNYHSKHTKEVIGASTAKRWLTYENDKRNKMLRVLFNNAQARKTYGPYDADWRKLSHRLRSLNKCSRCGNMGNLILHHIIPVKAGGERTLENLTVLCAGCHAKVEKQTNKVFEIVKDWEITAMLVKENLKETVINGTAEYENIGIKASS